MVTPTSPGTLKGNAIALIQGREPVSIRLAKVTLCLVGNFYVKTEMQLLYWLGCDPGHPY